MSYSISFFKSGLGLFLIVWPQPQVEGKLPLAFGVVAMKCLWHGVKVGGSASFPAASDLRVSFY